MYMLGIKGTVGYSVTKEYELKGLSGAPMCVEYIPDVENGDRSYLLWGNTRGLYMIYINSCLFKYSLYSCKNP